MDIVATANGTYEITGEVIYTIGEDGEKIGPISTDPVKMCVGPCDEQTEDGSPGLGVFVALTSILLTIAILRQK